MDRKAAKELAHIQGWLARVEEVTRSGKDAYLTGEVLQEAGDSLMMKLGEAANRLSRLGLLAPEGVDWALAVANRNFIIHQYDEIDRDLTWLTLSRDLPAWRASLEPLFPGRRDDRRSSRLTAASRGEPLKMNAGNTFIGQPARSHLPCEGDRAGYGAGRVSLPGRPLGLTVPRVPARRGPTS